jgi:histone deacetylase 1/2
MPAQNLQNSTPLACLREERPNYSFLRAFGCACWSNLRPYNNRKLSFRSRLCVFLGYSQQHKGYKCLDRSTGCIFVSRDVVFDENLFPYADPTPVSSPLSPATPTTFPLSEPVIQDDRMRNYDLTLLANTPATSSSFDAGSIGDTSSDSGSGVPHTPSASAPSSPSAAEPRPYLLPRQPVTCLAARPRLLPRLRPQQALRRLHLLRRSMLPLLATP